MDKINLHQFLELAVPYEEWRAPFDSNLRNATILGGICIFASFPLLFLLPAPQRLDTHFFWIMQDLFECIWWWLYHSRAFIAGLNLTSGIIFLSLLYITDGLQSGRIIWHWAAIGETIIGAMNAFVITFEIGIVLFNIVLWAAILSLIIAVLATFFGVTLIALMRR